MSRDYTMDWLNYCRICDALCGLNGDLSGDSSDLISEGFSCAEPQREELERILKPMKRHGQECSWEEALKSIAKELEQHHPSIGLYLSSEVGRSSADLFQSLAFGVSYGTKYIFSDQSLHCGPMLSTVEHMVGYPTTLLSDLSRTHYAILLGEDPEELHWGTHQLGQSYGARLKHSRTVRKTKVVTAHSQPYSWMKDVDLHLNLRPGTEPFLLLGLLKVSIDKNWVDSQYLRDYTRGYAEVVELLKPWTLERCADICGLTPSEISGVALKFSRAAMALAHPGPGFFLNKHGALGGWAWMALHMISANALRPGGIYENEGGIDLHPILISLPSAQAPHLEGVSLQLLQASVGQLQRTLEKEEIKVLIVAGDLPLSMESQALKEQLKSLDVLIVATHRSSWLSELADWVLPMAHPWEKSDRIVHRASALPVKALPYTKQYRDLPKDAKRWSDILHELHQIWKPSGFSKSEWGSHFRWIARGLAGRSAEEWIEQGLSLIKDNLETKPGLWFEGESDRGLWRPKEERLDFAPELLSRILREVSVPSEMPEFPLYLQMSYPVPRAKAQHPQVIIHPVHQKEAQDVVEIATPHGSVRAEVVLSTHVREDTVITNPHPLFSELLSGQHEPFYGAPILWGERCRIGS